MTITMTRPRGVGSKIAHDPGDPLVTSHCPFCFSFETKIITIDGIKTIGEVSGTEQWVLSAEPGARDDGRWVQAHIHEFGEQPLTKVTLRRNKREKIIYATPEHRWLVKANLAADRRAGRSRATDRFVETKDLRSGHRLSHLRQRGVGDLKPSVPGIKHGIVFGDGSANKSTATVSLWGEKDKQLLWVFQNHRWSDVRTPNGITGVRISNGLRSWMKAVPESDDGQYLYGWLAGYFAADGNVTAQGQVIIDSASMENLEAVQEVASRLGITTYGITSRMRTGFGVERPVHRLEFVGSTLNDHFFLIAQHRERFELRSYGYERFGWSVVSVAPTDRFEKVYCAVVPGYGTFTLEDNIWTGNCGSGQVVGRSDGTIGCDFCGQAYIVRVQPAFPGMPQMPNGPGAPSDVGPDGMVDPGMIGPDGMPMDGGPPPGEGDPDGNGPPGAPSGDDGDDAPAGGDGKEDDSDSGGPPKGKSKKKGARVYRGVRGQPLTEEQLIRHVAVVASGGSPVVMARLRAETARRVTAVFPDDAIHYRTLSSGHQVSLGRHGEDWYGIISAPHPHDRHTHMMSLGRGDDPREAAERALSRGPARDFVHSTTDWSGAKSGNPTTAPGGAWWNADQQRRPEDSIFHSASAR